MNQHAGVVLLLGAVVCLASTPVLACPPLVSSDDVMSDKTAAVAASATAPSEDPVAVASFEDVTLALSVGPRFDMQVRAQRYDGMGAQIWGYFSNPTALQKALTELRIKWVRIENYRENASQFQMAQTRNLTDALGIKWIYMIWSAPTSFANTQGQLRSNQIDDFAAWWADHVADLYNIGIDVEYIELMNEPDSGGQWSTGITGSQYNALLSLVRDQLNAYDGSDGEPDLRQVGIVGPGLSSMTWSNPLNYISAITAANAAHLAMWSTHTWTDDYYGGCAREGGSCLEQHWYNFASIATLRNPNIPKITTEHASKQFTYHGNTYPSPDETGGYNVTNCMPYAVRVYENILGILNAGATVPMLWQLIDEPTEVNNKNKAWGLLDLSGAEKPVYGALKTLAGEISDGAQILTPQNQHDVIYAGASLHEDRLVVGLANGSATQQSTLLAIDQASCIELVRARAFVLSQAGDPGAQTPDVGSEVARTLTVNPDHTIQVELPAGSTLTLVADVIVTPGDYNNDGSINAVDLDRWAECGSGPGGALPGACPCRDLDADSDADVADVALLQVLAKSL